MKNVDITTLRKNLEEIIHKIENAAERSGRKNDAVRLVAVTKSVDSQTATRLIELGCEDLGESRPQELARKFETLGDRPRWHLIGHLQRNKARRTLQIAQEIHSVDSMKLLNHIDSVSAQLGCSPGIYLEVNVAGEQAKQGFDPEQMPEVIAGAIERPNLKVCGLMAMAPQDRNLDSARRAFAQLRSLRDRLAEREGVPLPELSMGMSGDYSEAILEGATVVRIGSALFENRRDHSQ